MKTLRVVLAWFTVVAALYGQSTVGRISGTVEDASGSVVPGASVTVSNPQTGFKQVVETQESGLFVFPSLAPGTYTVEVGKTGFAGRREEGIVLDASSTRTLKFTLSLGSVVETISVSANAQQVQTSSGDVSRVIDSRQVSQVALNGRNLDQLLRLLPGVITSNGSGTTGQASSDPFAINLSSNAQKINGVSSDSINSTVDGISNDGGNNAFHAVAPNVDSVSEVRVLASSYAAEFGGQMGAQVSVVTKSGSSDLHGTLFEFFRNDKLDTRSFFALKKDPLHFNDFGGTIGGPIFIPHKFNTDRNKAFFFYSHESKFNHNGQTQTATVPTAEERAGNFQNSKLTAPVDPTTGVAFPNRIVPASRWSKNGPLLLGPIPLPNYSGANNFSLTGANIYESRQELFKIDYNPNDKLRLAVRYIHDSWPKWIEAFGGGATGVVPGTKPRPGLLVSGTASYSFTNQTINTLTFGVTADTVYSFPITDKITRSALGLTYPELFPSNYYGLGPDVSITGFTAYSLGQNFLRYQKATTVRDDLTSVKGAHILKFGFLYVKGYSLEYPTTDGTRGNVSFSTATKNTSKNALADVLLGNFRTYTESEFVRGHSPKYESYEFYAQDTWKATRRLNLDFGLRYSLFPPNYNGLGTSVSFEPSRFNPALAPRINPTDGTIVPGTGDPYNGLAFWGDSWPDAAKGLIPQYKNPALDRLFVGLPKGGTATHYNDFAPRFGFAYDVMGDGKMALRGGGGLFFDHQQNVTLGGSSGNPPISSSVAIQDGNIDSPGGGTTLLSPPSVTNVSQKDVPRVIDANVSLQRELPGHIIADVGYVGTFGHHLPRTLALNSLRPGTLLGANANVNINALRPYLGYGGISYTDYGDNSNYHALQISASRRMSQGLSFGFSYAYSKTMEYASKQDPYNPDPKADYGPASIDRRNVGSLNFQYDLPSLKNSNALLRGAVGGWAVAGVLSHQDGAPNSVTVSTDVAKTGGSSSRASLNGQDINLPADQRTTNLWFNTAAFLTVAQMPIGQYGNSGYDILTGPALNDADLSISKVFKLGEKATFQFRAESFNVLNHASFTGIGTTVGTASFGTITGAGPGRVFAFGAKLLF